MKLFRQFIANKITPQESENRLDKLGAEPQSTLEALVEGSQGDSQDLELRVAALEYLPYTEALRKAAAGAPAVLEKAARSKLAELLNDGKLSVSQLMKDIPQTETLLAIASSCDTSELQEAALAKIEDQAVLARLCANATSAAVRKTLAERINEPDLLRDLLKAFKNKDKSAYKIVRNTLDEQKAARDAKIEIQTAIADLCSNIEQHSQRFVDKDYIFKMESLARRWNEVQDQAQDIDKNRFAAALTVCRERAQEKIGEQHVTVEPEPVDEVVSETAAQRQALIDDLWGQLLGVYSWETSDSGRLDTVEERLAKLKENWNTLNELEVPGERDLRQFNRLYDALQIILKQYADKGTLIACRDRITRIGVYAEPSANEEPSADKEPSANEEPSANKEPLENTEPSANHKHTNEIETSADLRYLRNLMAPLSGLKEFKQNEVLASAQIILKNAAAKQEARNKEEREFKQKQIRIIGGLIRKSNAAVQQGRLKQALGIRHSIDDKLSAVDGLPDSMTAQLESLDEAIQKLVDWQAYAVVPKKQALVESMEALVGVDLPPEALATKIRKLQDEWKSLTQSGKDRKEDLWHRFSEAADKAYEPCKGYYQELSAVRRENLDKRKVLVNQLQEYLRENDWENADWRQVEKVLHNAREELHSYTPVERGSNKPILKAFDNAMAAIQAKLENEYSRNKHAKEQVIGQAEKLTDMADLGQATDTAKRLQAQWKQIGRCSYRENERLWKEFRRHCDAVFAKKENVMAEEKALLGGNLAQANELISELKNTLQLNGEKLLATRAEKDRIKQAFRELGPLPANADKVTRRNFAQNLEVYDDKVRKELQRAELEAWRTAFAINAAINDCQIDILDNRKDSDNIAELKDKIQSSIAATARWPDGAQPRIKQKLESDPQGEPESNQKALTLLCIRAEILADVATPAEDKGLRMEYQVNLLKKGLGQATTTSPESLVLEWLEVGPVAPDAYQALHQRFESLWQKLI
jgi:exonuclease SbcC